MKKLTKEELKDCVYGCMLYFDEICRKHNLKYMLSSGTCLGAVRHKDFIPWDDDADVFMDRENYNKFFEVMEKEKSNYRLFNYTNTDDYFFPFYKLADTRTVIVEGNTKPIKNLGVYLDIFPIDGLPAKHYKKHMAKFKVYKKFLTTKIYNQGNAFKRFVKKIISPFFSAKKLCGKMNNIAARYPISAENKAMDIVWGTKCFDGSIYNELIETKFRKHNFFISKKYDLYLKTIYGNYMQLPPEEKRVTHEITAYWREND